MKVRRCLRLYGELGVVFIICMLAWSDGKSCVACHVHLLYVWVGERYVGKGGFVCSVVRLLEGVSMPFSMFVSSGWCISVPLVSVY